MDYSEYSETRTTEGVIKNGLFRDTCNSFTHDVIVEIQPIDLKRRGRVTSLVNTLDKPRRENIIITVCI
jgi:hypothetical protein